MAKGIRMAANSLPGPDPIIIRPAVPDDAEAVHAAIVKMAGGAADRIGSAPEDLRRHGLGPHKAFSGLIAEIGGEFAGMCLYFPSFSTWRGTSGVYVQDLFVEPRFRGRNIGERLIRRLASLTREQGGTYLRLAVDVDNVSAQAFYERLGIVRYPADRIHAAYDDAFQALCERGGELP
ncbi:GNAT family N-acetyltransferase [Mesorhizobium sp. L-8-3]|uniref:GNAT family N-acetyltransferase n=1 Tax=Mesorhizobium sp. L-8-3 TaxID=2744522 RepID=UPI001936EAB0|nr:GNAT family N-acetyltransferase [Mesorhizobium sp. L-8-3]BCH23973.1 N-acetyltransferase [Mesorhizobium sp. L-8-3]